jgi:hypothetical protein
LHGKQLGIVADLRRAFAFGQPLETDNGDSTRDGAPFKSSCGHLPSPAVLICLDGGFRLGQTHASVIAKELDGPDLLVNIRGMTDVGRQIEGVAGGNALDVIEATVAQEGVELSFDDGQSLRDIG